MSIFKLRDLGKVDVWFFGFCIIEVCCEGIGVGVEGLFMVFDIVFSDSV